MDKAKDVESIMAALGEVRKQARMNAVKCEKEGNDIDKAYWSGKVNGLSGAIMYLDNLLYGWSREKEKELEEMAAERSEKDCMWEGSE